MLLKVLWYVWVIIDSICFIRKRGGMCNDSARKPHLKRFRETNPNLEIVESERYKRD